jgi:hypothetical protein
MTTSHLTTEALMAAKPPSVPTAPRAQRRICLYVRDVVHAFMLSDDVLRHHAQRAKNDLMYHFHLGTRYSRGDSFELIEILRFAQNDNITSYNGGTDGGEAAISAYPRERSIVILSAAKNLFVCQRCCSTPSCAAQRRICLYVRDVAPRLYAQRSEESVWANCRGSYIYA